MALIAIFLLGIANFALHKAVLDSGHPLIKKMPWFVNTMGRRLTLLTEYLVLLSAMMLAAYGWPGLAWAYAGYSAINGIAAWLILSGRI